MAGNFPDFVKLSLTKSLYLAEDLHLTLALLETKIVANRGRKKRDGEGLVVL